MQVKCARGPSHMPVEASDRMHIHNENPLCLSQRQMQRRSQANEKGGDIEPNPFRIHLDCMNDLSC